MRFTKAVLVELLIFVLFGLFFAAIGRADQPPTMGYLGKGRSRLSFAAPVQKAEMPRFAARRKSPLHLYRHVHRPHLPHFGKR
jgi:hypothetical protein